MCYCCAVEVAMPVSTVTRETAHQKRIHHQFIAGLGYVAHSAPPDLPQTARGNKNCNPPTGTQDGTLHLMQPPTGAPPIAMVWLQREQAWASTNIARANRLAWPVTHLSRAGWEYSGPQR